MSAKERKQFDSGFRIAKTKVKFPNISQMLLCYVGICTFAALLRNSDIAIGYMRYGLKLCFETVIPSLFPFMVLSGLFVEFGGAQVIGALLAKPIGALLGISGAGVCAPIMGALCGFPIGATTACRLYENGQISQNEFERLLTFSNNPSSAFLVSAVGSALWSCRRFGVVLYVIQLLASLLIGVFLRIFYPLNLEKKEFSDSLPERKVKGVRIFTRSVSDAANSMLTVCAFVVFFASVVGALTNMLEGLGVNQISKSLIFGFFEMSGAVSLVARISSVETGLILTALCVGWSGLSVHFQVMSMCGERKIRFRPYFIAKAAQGILSASMLLFYIRVINPELPQRCVPVTEVEAIEKGFASGSILIIMINIFFLLAVFSKFVLKIKSKKSQP